MTKIASRPAALLALATAALSWVSGAPLGRPSPEARKTVDGNTAFALDLYGELRGKPGNLFVSPYSISTALAMTYAGARGNTEAQMAKVLHFALGQDALHGQFRTLEATLNPASKKRGYELSVANALWGDQGYKFLDAFLAVVKDNYGGNLRRLDFRGATEAARQRINAWVEEKTNGKIKDLIPRGILDANTRLVLTNAIYFKGDWQRAFKKSRTRDLPFTRGDGSKVAAPMMSQTAHFGYAETPQFQALAMPYVGRDVSMVVFLPRKHDGLPALERSLSPESLAKWLRPTRWPREVRVLLPRFTMASEFRRLARVLQAMGMTDAFRGATADLSGMNGRKYDLFIAAVIHKAFVDVNEKGTEAAAATAVVAKDNAIQAPPPVFRADHPFLFLIRHNPTGSILFMGRVADPTKEE